MLTSYAYSLLPPPFLLYISPPSPLIITIITQEEFSTLYDLPTAISFPFSIDISQNTETWIFAHKNKTLIRKSSQSTMLSTTPTKMFCVISIENGKLIAVGRS